MVRTCARNLGTDAARRTKSLLKSTHFFTFVQQAGDPVGGLLYQAEILGNDVIDGPCGEAKGLLDAA